MSTLDACSFSRAAAVLKAVKIRMKLCQNWCGSSYGDIQEDNLKVLK